MAPATASGYKTCLRADPHHRSPITVLLYWAPQSSTCCFSYGATTSPARAKLCSSTSLLRRRHSRLHCHRRDRRLTSAACIRRGTPCPLRLVSFPCACLSPLRPQRDLTDTRGEERHSLNTRVLAARAASVDVLTRCFMRVSDLVQTGICPIV